MTRSHRLLFILALVGLMLLTVGAVAAKDRRIGRPDKGHSTPVQARITWSSPRLVQAVVAGQPSTVSATFTSSADLSNVVLQIPGLLGKIMQAAPARFDHLAANTPTTVTFTIALPANRKAGISGVVQVVSSKRVLANPLVVQLTVPRSVPHSGTPRPVGAPANIP